MIKVMLKFKDKVLKETTTVDQAITIGRDPDNVIRIDNPAVSKHHARIIKEQDQFFIEDLNSTNGTYINEKPIRRLALRDDDEVIIGKHTLKILMKEKLDWRPDWNMKDMCLDRTMKLETKQHKKMLEE
jgi:pSer/pThr/pTyr-binding forkhead associated (FHA) protein